MMVYPKTKILIVDVGSIFKLNGLQIFESEEFDAVVVVVCTGHYKSLVRAHRVYESELKKLSGFLYPRVHGPAIILKYDRAMRFGGFLKQNPQDIQDIQNILRAERVNPELLDFEIL